jgi:sarcosine oxidase gamma subunit
VIKSAFIGIVLPALTPAFVLAAGAGGGAAETGAAHSSGGAPGQFLRQAAAGGHAELRQTACAKAAYSDLGNKSATRILINISKFT